MINSVISPATPPGIRCADRVGWAPIVKQLFVNKDVTQSMVLVLNLASVDVGRAGKENYATGVVLTLDVNMATAMDNPGLVSATSIGEAFYAIKI